METKVKIMLGITVLAAIFSFIPTDEGLLIWLKLIVFIALLALIYFNNVISQIDKKFQILVDDVRSDRQKQYRDVLLKELKSFGETFTMNESSNEVAVGVRSKSTLERVKKIIDSSKLKIQHTSTICVLKYSSLEAGAKMTVGITGYATPGSEVFIEGLKEKIKVNSDGGFHVQVPMSVIKKYSEQGYIPAKCKKGKLEEIIKIDISK